MRAGTIIKHIINSYFDRNLDLRVQVYNLLAFVGIFAGISVAFIAVLIKESITTVIINAMISVLSFIFLNVAKKRHCYRFCSWVVVIVVFLFVCPLLFFSCGGYKSGAAYSFILGIVFTAILLERYERIIALAVEVILYISCCLIAFYKPETAAILSSEADYVFILILNFMVTCILLSSVILIHTRIFNIRRLKIEELNRELEARNKTLTQYDKMKSDFLATVAHEINTPLAVISASSGDTMDLLKESPLNIDEIIGNQMAIERRVKMIDNVLLDLMDTVAIETGRISLNRQPVELSGLLRNICDIHFRHRDLNNNSITYDLQSNLPHIWIDQSRIEQVMINLLSNAIRNTKNGNITIALKQTDKTQTVSVADNGEGMDEETSQAVLNRYISTKEDYWRHGIGLYICRQIITAHGGDIWINSKKGQGTVVTFVLNEGADYE